MISFVRGTVASVSQTVVLEVSGLGVELHPTARCRAALEPGTNATVTTALVVREESWTLYGFADEDERSCFQTLQLTKGVGPRMALNLLAALRPDQLRAAVASGDSATLTAVPGMGPKGAQRLVIDLRDRLGPVVGAGPVPHVVPTASGWRKDVQLALVGLGWTAADAAAAVSRIESDAEPGGQGCSRDGTPDAGQLLRLALRTLDRTGAAR